MKRSILWQYIDACELARETREDLLKLEQRAVVHDKVYGSNPDFPYEPRGFSIHGAADITPDRKKLDAERKLLEQREQKAERIRTDVEKWLNTLPPRAVRIIRMHYFQQLSWSETARVMGRGATADSIRMEIKKYF